MDDHRLTGEPLSGELRLEVKRLLEDDWRWNVEDIYRRYLKARWHYPRRLHRTTDKNQHFLKLLCNKFTALYIQRSAQLITSSGLGLVPMLILDCIYKQWSLHYNNAPDIQFDRFFVEPVPINAKAPDTIAEIVRSHKVLCSQAAQLLDAMKRREVGARPEDREYRRQRKLLPLYRAIILILDKPVTQEIEPDENGIHSIDEYSQVQSILMIRTGDQSHLRTPISFQLLKERAQTLPLRRIDWIPEGIEAVRVFLTTAVHFISDLQQREDAASPNVNYALDKNLCINDAYSAEEFSEKVLQEADELGLQKSYSANSALDVALAIRRGDPFYCNDTYNDPQPFSGRRWR